MSESIVLDPAAVASGRTEIDITAWVAEEGPDWGDAAIEAYMADLAVGSASVDYRIPNRTITIPLKLRDRPGGSFATVRANLMAKAALFQAEGGWLKRQSAVGVLYADIEKATLHLGDHTLTTTRGIDPDAVLTLECLPDFYQDEITLGLHAATSPEMIFTEAAIAGNYPARGRLILTEASAQNQLGLLWGVRSRYYDAATTARLVYEAEALTPLDVAALTALTGASGAGSNTVRHNSLASSWTPVLSTDLAGTGPLTHKGSYRIWARCYSTSPTPPSVRLVWDVGDFLAPTSNDPVTIPVASQFFLADLGEVRLDAAPVGTHRWKGVIQARGALGGENVYVDRLWLQPLDEAAGRIVAPLVGDIGLTTFSARDEFNQTAGVLNAKTLAVGGTWATSGDATDFSVVAGTSHTLQRASISDVNGRTAIAGATTFTDIVVQLDFNWATIAATVLTFDLIARYVDASNSAWVQVDARSNNQVRIILAKRIAGVGTQITPDTLVTVAPNAWYSMRLLVTSQGSIAAAIFPQGGTPTSWFVVASDAALATGGVLATGKLGFFDYNQSAVAIARNFDNFGVWVPQLDAAVFASRIAELRDDGVFRQDAAGAAYGPASQKVGDHLRLPPSGVEARTLEVLVKPTRGDFNQLADTGLDLMSAQLKYRPCYLFRP